MSVLLCCCKGVRLGRRGREGGEKHFIDAENFPNVPATEPGCGGTGERRSRALRHAPAARARPAPRAQPRTTPAAAALGHSDRFLPTSPRRSAGGARRERPVPSVNDSTHRDRSTQSSPFHPSAPVTLQVSARRDRPARRKPHGISQRYSAQHHKD